MQFKELSVHVLRHKMKKDIILWYQQLKGMELSFKGAEFFYIYLS